MMALDDVVSSKSEDDARFTEATHRTLRWIDRCIKQHANPERQVHARSEERETARQRDRETERQKQTERQRDRNRQRDRQRETERGGTHLEM